MYQTQPTQVMFYIMPELVPESASIVNADTAETSTNTEVEQNTQTDNKQPAFASWQQACLQAAYYYRQQQKVFIYTDNQDCSHQIDQLLWSFEPDSFVPHNLIGEGPKQGAAVEIGHQPSSSRRPILINLASQVPNFAGNYQQVIDFVPSDEALKQQARARFRHYKQLGFNVQTQAAESKQAQQSSACNS